MPPGIHHFTPDEEGKAGRPVVVVSWMAMELVGTSVWHACNHLRWCSAHGDLEGSPDTQSSTQPDAEPVARPSSPLSRAWITTTGVGMLKAVADMHARGFIHRDIKTEVSVDGCGWQRLHTDTCTRTWHPAVLAVLTWAVQNFCLSPNDSNARIFLLDYGFARCAYGACVVPPRVTHGVQTDRPDACLHAATCAALALADGCMLAVHAGHYSFYDHRKPVASFWGTPNYASLTSLMSWPQTPRCGAVCAGKGKRGGAVLGAGRCAPVPCKYPAATHTPTLLTASTAPAHAPRDDLACLVFCMLEMELPTGRLPWNDVLTTNEEARDGWTIKQLQRMRDKKAAAWRKLVAEVRGVWGCHAQYCAWQPHLSCEAH
jgi:serine/threonine protein kinase